MSEGRPAASSYIDAPPLPAELSTEPWSERAAAWRLSQLRKHLPFEVPECARFAGGQSNDAWLFGRDVLRICWRSDRGRLLREAQILSELPNDVPHAVVSAAGQDARMSWVLSPRLAGRPLLELQDLSTSTVRDVFAQLADILKTLHAWSPSPQLLDILRDRPDMDPRKPMSVWAADFVPLPLPRLTTVASLAKSVPFVDSALIDAAVARISSLAEHDPFPIDESAGACVVHGDATTANILVKGGRISGLIDFEYARWAPRDLELLSPVTFAGGFGVDWLQEDYPELFEGEGLRERVWLYELCCAVRTVIWWPPEEPQDGDADEHPPIQRLRDLIDAPTEW